MRGIVKLKLDCGRGQRQPEHGIVVDQYRWVGFVRIVLARVLGERQGDILDPGTQASSHGRAAAEQ